MLPVHRQQVVAGAAAEADRFAGALSCMGGEMPMCLWVQGPLQAASFLKSAKMVLKR